MIQLPTAATHPTALSSTFGHLPPPNSQNTTPTPKSASRLLSTNHSLHGYPFVERSGGEMPAYLLNLPHNSVPPPHILRAEQDWRVFSSQSWVTSGGTEPMDVCGRSTLHAWLDRPGPQVYVCKVPVRGCLCGAEHTRQDRALSHIRKHLNARPFAYECSGQCGNPDW